MYTFHNPSIIFRTHKKLLSPQCRFQLKNFNSSPTEPNSHCNIIFLILSRTTISLSFFSLYSFKTVRVVNWCCFWWFAARVYTHSIFQVPPASHTHKKRKHRIMRFCFVNENMNAAKLIIINKKSTFKWHKLKSSTALTRIYSFICVFFYIHQQMWG